MKYIFSFFVFILTVNIYSQSITGIVLDRESGDPLESASVRLLTAGDSTAVSGTATDPFGLFSFTGVRNGAYNIQVQMVGYSSIIVRGIIVNRDNRNVRLDTIRLSSGTAVTEEITIESERSDIEVHPDKKVFNIERSKVFTGGNAIDVLKNIPSVTVDEQNNVSLRGSQNVKIMVDGRPFGLEGNSRTLILEQLSADQISSIEVITNPSAKYEAEGTSGIINILLKKNEGTGYNGSLMLNAGTKDKYRGSMVFNMKQKQYNLFGSYDFNQRSFTFTGVSERNYADDFGIYSFLNEDAVRSMKMMAHMVKAGIDYNISPLTSINLTGNYSNRTRKGSGNELTQIFDKNGQLVDKYINVENSEDKGYNYELSTSFLQRFKSPKQNLSADINFSYEKESDDEEGSLINYVTGQAPLRNRELNDELNKSLRAQADYVHPFNEVRRLDAGVKYTLRDRDDDFRYEELDTVSNIYYLNTDVSNRFRYKENIYSAYSTFTDKFGDLGIQLGVRGEYTNTNGDLINTAENFSQKYFDLFPSASLSYSVGKGSEIQLSYSRRINRPHLRMLNPFMNISNPNNIRKGNPELKPEYIDSYEIGFLQYFGRLSVVPSVFYRNTNDRIGAIRSLIDSNTTLVTFVNYDNSRSYGAEFMANGQVMPWWSINGSVSWFRTQLDATNVGTALRNSDSWTARLMSSMSIPEIINFQANYFYSGKMYMAQGYIEPMQSLDIALNRDIIKDRLNLALRVSDVFNTQEHKMVFEDALFTESAVRKRESRNVFLTLTYKFGEDSRDRNTRRRRESERDQEPDLEDF